MIGGAQRPSDADVTGVVEVERRPRHEIRPPRNYLVLMHNDAYTTQEFVVMCLMMVFYHPQPRAEAIMLDVHCRGVGVVGTYSREVAESKVARVMSMARAREYPLRCTLELE